MKNNKNKISPPLSKLVVVVGDFLICPKVNYFEFHPQ